MTNHTLESTLAALRSTLTVTPEFPPESAAAQTKEPLDGLLRDYPDLSRFPAYLDFLRLTGGAHIHSADVSLGIYGFGGYLVASFDEGLFLDQDRYFHFGEVLYVRRPEPVFVFAFDLAAESDVVLTSPIEQGNYTICAPSFLEFLDRFARGDYPHALT